MNCVRGWWTLPLLLLGAALALAQPAVVHLTARGLPLAEAVASVLEQAGLTVAPDAVELPDVYVDLLLQTVTADYALGQLLAPHGLTHEIAGGQVTIRVVTTATRAAEPVSPASVPAPAGASEAERLLRAAYAAPGDRAVGDALGWHLRALRPDRREAFLAALPGLLTAWGAGDQQWLDVGRLLGRLGQVRTARQLLQRVPPNAALRGPALLATAELAVANDDPALAQRTVLDMGAWAVNRPEVAALSARARYLAGDTALGMVDATLAVSRWPDSAATQAVYGDLLRAEGNQADASLALQAALAADPLQPEARFAAAALASAEGGGPAAWAAYVADEPFSLRSARVQLGVATVSRMSTSRHGGQVWDVSADGTRILYADAFRGQLQATDVAGMGLAAQLTDQESEKRWAAWSPDEQWLAWVTDGALWLQRTGSSGTHRPVLRTNAGRTLRRTAWTADGQYLLVSEVAVREQSSVLRCYSLAESAEVPPPAPLDRPGLGDVRCLPDGSVLAVLTVAAQQAIVQIQPDGATQLLRPWATWGSYTAPDLAPDGQRVLWHDGLSDQLLVGPADGSEGWLVPLAGSTASAAGARFVPGGAAVVYSAHGRRPIWLGLDGLAPPLALRVSWPAPGETAPRAAWIAAGSERVAIVALADAADGLRELGRGRLGDGLAVDLPREPGEHWLCLTLAEARQDELPRWYRWVVPAG